MKKHLLLVGLFLSFTIASVGQMSLVHSFSGSYFYEIEVVNLSLSGKKIAVVRNQETVRGADTIFYYNLDYSLWKTIPCPQIDGYFGVFAFGYVGGGVTYSSETLFNTDTFLEVAVNYIDSANSGYGKLLIINENGILVDSIPNIENQTFNIHSVSSTDFIATIWTTTGPKVYSLPGTLPCDACGGALGLAKVEDKQQNILSQPMPNPSKDQVKITFTLPDGVSRAELDIYNTSGQKVKSYQVDNRFGFIMVDNSQLASGVYYYNIVANGVVSSSQKMLVIK